MTSAASGPQPGPVPVPAHVPADRVFIFDIYSDATLDDDVHLAYLSMFKAAPRIFWTPLNGGHWIVMGRNALGELLRHPERFSSRQLHIPADEHGPVFIPAALDPPEHATYRDILMPHFSPRAVQAREAEVRALAIRLIEQVRPQGACEFIHDIAEQLPISVFMKMMGLPAERFDDFRAMALGILRTNDTDERIRLFHQVIGELDMLVALRTVDPQDDLISAILAARIGGAPLEPHRTQQLCLNLFLGGLDTVTSAMGFVARHIADDPQLAARLAADASLIGKAIEETFRRYGFVHAVRRAVADTTCQGVEMRAGDMIFCALPTVGFDDDANPEPEVFDLQRKLRTHWVFSHGIHNCVGMHLAKLELRILFEEWLKAIPDFAVSGDTRLHAHAGIVMGLDRLPLTWPMQNGSPQGD